MGTHCVSQTCLGYFNIHYWLPVQNLRHWHQSQQCVTRGRFTIKSTTVLALSTSNHPRASKSPTACTTLVHGKYATNTSQVFYVCLKLHVRYEVMYVRTYVWMDIRMHASKQVRTYKPTPRYSLHSQPKYGTHLFFSHPAVCVCMCVWQSMYVRTYLFTQACKYVCMYVMYTL